MYKYNFSLPEGIERSITQGEQCRRRNVKRADPGPRFDPLDLFDFLFWVLSRPYGYSAIWGRALTEIFDRIDPADIIGKEARGLYSAIRGRYRLDPDPRKQARRHLPEMSNYLERQKRNADFYRRRGILLNADPADFPPPEIAVPAPDEISGLVTEFLEARSAKPAPQKYRFTGGEFEEVITVCAVEPKKTPRSHARGDRGADRLTGPDNGGLPKDATGAKIRKNRKEIIEDNDQVYKR